MVNFVGQFSLLIFKFLWCDLLVTSEHCKMLNGLSSQKLNAFYLSLVLVQKKVNKGCKEAIMYYHNIGSQYIINAGGLFSGIFFFSLVNNTMKKFRIARQHIHFDKQFCLKKTILKVSRCSIKSERFQNGLLQLTSILSGFFHCPALLLAASKPHFSHPVLLGLLSTIALHCCACDRWE